MVKMMACMIRETIEGTCLEVCKIARGWSFRMHRSLWKINIPRDFCSPDTFELKVSRKIVEICEKLRECGPFQVSKSDS